MRLNNVKSKIDTGAARPTRTTRSTRSTTRASTVPQPEARKRRQSETTTTKRARVQETSQEESFSTPVTDPSDDPYSLPPKPKKSGIPQWDHKGQLELLKPYTAALTKKFLFLVDERKKVLSDLNSINEEKSNVFSDLEQVKQRLTDAANLENSLNSTISDLQSNVSDLESRLEHANAKISTLEGEVLGLNSSIDSLKQELTCSNDKVSQLENDLQLEQCSSSNKQKALDSLDQELLLAKTKITELEAKLRESDITRKQLHNDIMELKGNIRVFVRVRPLLDNEHNEDEDVFQYPDVDHKCLLVTGEGRTSVTGERSDRKVHKLDFDRVFSESEGQKEVFDEVSQLVQSALDGFGVVIFAYGQTGSGKTYTMEGTPTNPGIIPRSVDLLFDTVYERRNIGFSCSMKLSTIEVYNDSLFDLLCNSSVDGKPLEMKLVDGKMIVSGLSKEEVSSRQQVFDLFAIAQNNRRTAATKCNDRSSRSHLVFCLEIESYDPQSGNKYHGVLNLIDLAGSERIVLSGSIDDPERRKEAISINKTLHALGNCISAMSKKSGHIPFRDSKLTWLLQQSLGGSSKVLMFANVPCFSGNIGESLNTLRFAKKVNEVNVSSSRQGSKAEKSKEFNL
ncbi:hypothetical protein P9112_002053 [Eukaryota sp. TZLM1-RC]